MPDSQWEEVLVEQISDQIAERVRISLATDTPMMTWIEATSPRHLTFVPCGIAINLETGNVTIPDDLPLTDAAKAFWEAVMRMTGQRCGFD